MAHRIVKKTNTHHQPKQYETSNQENIKDQKSYNAINTQQNNQSIRPIIEKTDKVYKHDKSSYRKNLPSFPPAESLFISENTYDAGP